MKFILESKYVADGLVTAREHVTEPYFIYNYTPKCQFSKAWDATTMQCRGMIVHKDTDEIIARPFKKFFNYDEHINNGGIIPDEIPLVYDKRDGSLGILYFLKDGSPAIATRGSFTSDQAIWATEWFKSHILKSQLAVLQILKDKVTFLFEIIFPQNRIVIDYGDYQGLDLLAVIDNETGDEIEPNLIERDLFKYVGTPVEPLAYAPVSDLKARNEANKEGFILHYKDARLRLKVKFDDYVKLHKVVTGLSQIGIWEMLRDGKDITTVIGETPDEMHGWIQQTMGDLKEKFDAIDTHSKRLYTQVKEMKTRKEQAQFLTSMHPKYAGIVFMMLDAGDYQPIIWKMIRPRGAMTFRKDIDA